MSAPLVSTEPSRLFMILLFAGAIVIGVAITYFGITGALGGPIP
ncbi:MAG: hypothetical protein WB789_05890 [Thermoplasmata archaeon]